MIATLSLKDMTIEDKISTMEYLWDDICKTSCDYPSPKWHGKLLEEREDNLKKGKDKFEDWETVKRDIWDSVK